VWLREAAGGFMRHMWLHAPSFALPMPASEAGQYCSFTITSRLLATFGNKQN